MERYPVRHSYWHAAELVSLTMHIGADLVGTTYNPIFGTSPCAVLTAKHVTAESGTGLVHTAPAHDAEDYAAWYGNSHRGDIICPVDGEGKFTDSVGEKWARLIGKEVLGDGNIEVIRILSEQGFLVKKEALKHRYPYDWKTKKPVILRYEFFRFTSIGER